MVSRMTTRTAAACGASLVLLALFSTTAVAQSAAPRDYLLGPVNQASLFLDFVGGTSETAAASDLPLPNNASVNRSFVATALYSFPITGRYYALSGTMGRARVKVESPSGAAETSGWTDPGVTFHTNIFGGPALSAEQFRSFVPRTFASIHVTVNGPLGSYDSNAPANTGSNRWTMAPVVNLTITRDKGVSWLDLYAGGRFSTKNDAYNGHSELTQSPLGTLTVHYSHNIGKKMWAGAGLYYDFGGETTIDGIPQDDSASGFRPSATLSALLGKFRVTVRYDNTASTPRAIPTNGKIVLRFSGPLF
jgi:hypothetical protein